VRRTPLLKGIAAAILVSLLLPHLAVAGCTTGRTGTSLDYYFDGYGKPGSSVNFASASIQRKDPTVLAAWSAAWVGLQGTDALVQTGWMKKSNGTWVTFREYFWPGQSDVRFEDPPDSALNGFAQYAVRRNASQYCYEINAATRGCVTRQFTSSSAPVRW